LHQIINLLYVGIDYLNKQYLRKHANNCFLQLAGQSTSNPDPRFGDVHPVSARRIIHNDSVGVPRLRVSSMFVFLLKIIIQYSKKFKSFQVYLKRLLGKISQFLIFSVLENKENFERFLDYTLN
jgi:hypothetical protein